MDENDIAHAGHSLQRLFERADALPLLNLVSRDDTHRAGDFADLLFAARARHHQRLQHLADLKAEINRIRSGLAHVHCGRGGAAKPRSRDGDLIRAGFDGGERELPGLARHLPSELVRAGVLQFNPRLGNHRPRRVFDGS